MLDARSNVVLEHRDKVHHDVAPLAGGGMVVPDKSIHFYRAADGLLRRPRPGSSPEGRSERRWSTWDARDRLAKLHPPSPLDRPGRWSKLLARSYDYYHLNTVESLPETALGRATARFRAGNLLLCLRNPALLLILDQDTEEMVWSWGPGELDGPHLPTLLDNGHLLVFDNGTDRDHSRVIELDPVTLDGDLGVPRRPTTVVPLQVAGVEPAAAQRRYPDLRERPRPRLRGHPRGRDGVGVLEPRVERGSPPRDLPLHAGRRGSGGVGDRDREKRRIDETWP